MNGQIEERLREIARRLPVVQARTLLDFAEFLLARHAVPEASTAPLELPRPDTESVLGALRRLRTTYPMLDPADLLQESSALMSTHLTQGRAATVVIDELETLFRRQYEKLRGPE
mgnify:CR=1 FL=1